MPNKKYVEYNFTYPKVVNEVYNPPSKYYVNVETGHNVFKRAQVNLTKPVGIDKNGVVELLDEGETEKDNEEK